MESVELPDGAEPSPRRGPSRTCPGPRRAARGQSSAGPSGPQLPPPAVAAAAAGLQLLLSRGGSGTPNTWSAAAGLAGASLGVISGAAAQLFSIRTTISPHHPRATTVLVRTGLYGLSRNPIYLGIAGLLLAHAVGRGSARAVLPVAGFVLVLDRTQIRAEEAALADRFGAEFVQYAARVPRWL